MSASKRHSRDYIERTIETVRVHRDADNSWPQWANVFADEIERLWEQYEPDTDEPLPAPPTWEQLDAANQRCIDLLEQFDAVERDLGAHRLMLKDERRWRAEAEADLAACKKEREMLLRQVTAFTGNA